MRIKRRDLYCALSVVCALVVHSSALADLEDGLIAFWPFDEGEGNVATDIIGGHDAQLHGALWADDARAGNALSFSPERGKDKWGARVENTPDIDELPNGFTFAHWMKPKSRGSMIDKSGDDATRIQWFLLDTLQHHWGINNTVGFAFGPDEWGEWYHVVWSHEPGHSAVFRDGEHIFTLDTLLDVPVTGKPMYFGTRIPEMKFAREQRYGGLLDEIAMWNRALSPEEIKEVFDQGMKRVLAVSPRGKLATTWAMLKRP